METENDKTDIKMMIFNERSNSVTPAIIIMPTSINIVSPATVSTSMPATSTSSSTLHVAVPDLDCIFITILAVVVILLALGHVTVTCSRRRRQKWSIRSAMATSRPSPDGAGQCTEQPAKLAHGRGECTLRYDSWTRTKKSDSRLNHSDNYRTLAFAYINRRPEPVLSPPATGSRSTSASSEAALVAMTTSRNESYDSELTSTAYPSSCPSANMTVLTSSMSLPSGASPPTLSLTSSEFSDTNQEEQEIQQTSIVVTDNKPQKVTADRKLSNKVAPTTYQPVVCTCSNTAVTSATSEYVTPISCFVSITDPEDTGSGADNETVVERCISGCESQSPSHETSRFTTEESSLTTVSSHS